MRELPRFPNDVSPSDADAQPSAAPGPPPRSVLLVDFRDEVFARLKTDLKATGIRVVCAKRMQDAHGLCKTALPDLLVVNVDRTDEASWLRARKLHDEHPEVEVWVVTSWASSVDRILADYVRASQMIYYGDLWRLADEIRGRLAWQCGSTASRTGTGPSVRAA